MTILLLLLAGLTARRWLAPKVPTTSGASHRERTPLVFFVAAAGLMWMLSLGPAPKVAGTAIGLPGPYAILAMLPGFDGMRVPARLWMVAVMCLAVAAALVVARIQDRRTRRIAIAVSVVRDAARRVAARVSDRRGAGHARDRQPGAGQAGAAAA